MVCSFRFGCMLHAPRRLTLSCCLVFSMSSFDPDSQFISNVLDRLEAVMGFQIVSSLAKVHSQLTTISGVQLQSQVDRYGHKIALPDPQILTDM